MKHNLQDDRETYLDKDYKEKWDNVSKKYWKERLLWLFQNWFEKIKDWESFKYVFKNKIIDFLNKQKWQLYIQKKTFLQLISLFGKFQYFYEKSKKRVFNNLSENNEGWKSVQNYTKQEIKTTLNRVPKEEQINPWEKKYMQINIFWDVVAPWDTKNIETEYINEEEPVIMKQNHNQLKLPFDDI